MLTLRDSPDELIHGAGIQTRTSRKWSLSDRVCEPGREQSQALGHRQSDSCQTSRGRCNKGNSVESISTEGDESINPVRSKESRGTCKTSKGSRDGSAGSIDYVKPQTGRYPGEISGSMSHWFFFLLWSVYDILPSAANLCCWGLTTDSKCSLYDKPITLEHALSQGRYRWRHNSVLRELADLLKKERKKVHCNNPQHGHIALSSWVIPARNRQRNLHCRVVV